MKKYRKTSTYMNYVINNKKKLIFMLLFIWKIPYEATLLELSMNLDPHTNDIDISELTVLDYGFNRYYSSSCGYYFVIDSNHSIVFTSSSATAKMVSSIYSLMIGDIITGKNRNAFIDAVRRIRPTKDDARYIARCHAPNYFFIRNLQILPEIQDEILKKLIALDVDGFIFY